MEQQESSPPACKERRQSCIAMKLNNSRGKGVFFSRSIYFVLGLLFTYRFVEYAVFSILLTHIEGWATSNLTKAVAIVNFKDGAFQVLQIIFAYIADAYLGIFPMLISSIILYIIGLVLCFIAASLENGVLHLGIFYTALVLITLSQSAERVTLKSFFGYQILPKDLDERITQEYDEKRTISSGKFYWNIVSLLTSIVAIVVTSLIESFKVLSMVSSVAMGIGFLWFSLGVRFYTRVEPTGSPLSDVACVICTAVARRNVEYPQSPEQLQPRVSWLRWLDRAAIVVQDPEKPGNNNSNIWTVEKVMEVKFLLKMFPLWATFLTFSLVAATGDTFFLEEGSNIREDFPSLLFIVLQKGTEFVVAEISSKVLEKIGKKKNNKIVQRLILVRIGIGMVCCGLCCIAAWINARHWLSLVKIQRKWDERGLVEVYRMVPQYLLLGAMEGLSVDGLESFFDSRVSKPISIYGFSFGECVMGVGKFLSIVCVLSLSKLFKNDINKTRLDKYYWILVMLSTANLVVYCLVAYWHGDGIFPVEDYRGDIEQIQEVRVPEQSQPLQADNRPSSEIKTVPDQNQKATLSSDSNDDEAERMNCDTQSTDHNPPGIANGPSNSSPLVSKVRTFPRMPSRRPSRRFNSMH